MCLAVVAVLALCAVSTSAIATAPGSARAATNTPSICDAYSTALGLSQFNFMNVLVSRMLSGVVDVEPALGGASGSFVALTRDNTMLVISTANFGSASLVLKLNYTSVGGNNRILTVARRPSTGMFYFMDQVGQLYNADVQAAIIAAAPSLYGAYGIPVALQLQPIGSAVARSGLGSSIGYVHTPTAARPRRPRRFVCFCHL